MTGSIGEISLQQIQNASCDRIMGNLTGTQERKVMELVIMAEGLPKVAG